MGKKTRLREQNRRAAELSVKQKLQRYTKAERQRPPAIEHFADFSGEQRRNVECFSANALRRPQDWQPAVKTRCAEKRYIDLVRFTFARYPVPPHLEAVWRDAAYYDVYDGIETVPPRLGLRVVNLRDWYITVAQGGSLYRAGTRDILSKAETHHFLAVPRAIASVRRALWYAIARAQGEANVAVAIAQSKIEQFSVGSTYWKEVARFLARNPLPRAQVDDLIDYLAAAKREDANFSLKGRTLTVLRKRMEAWHRALRKQRVVAGGAWDGSALPDVVYEAGNEEHRAFWRFRQIKTGNELFREGEAMHHCVVTYKSACLAGVASIWSLTSEYPVGKRNRGVTIEVRGDGRIVQVRGFANRRPYANEVAMVERWATDHGLVLSAYY